jgi:hypothetical protein
MKPIRLSEHALRYTSKRGFTIPEIEETIRTSPWMPAELGRLDCRRNFPYGKEMERQSLCDQTGSPDLRRGSWRNSCDHGLHLLF